MACARIATKLVPQAKVDSDITVTRMVASDEIFADTFGKVDSD